jgi:hypothetical protein
MQVFLIKRESRDESYKLTRCVQYWLPGRVCESPGQLCGTCRGMSPRLWMLHCTERINTPAHIAPRYWDRELNILNMSPEPAGYPYLAVSMFYTQKTLHAA